MDSHISPLFLLFLVTGYNCAPASYGIGGGIGGTAGLDLSNGIEWKGKGNGGGYAHYNENFYGTRGSVDSDLDFKRNGMSTSIGGHLNGYGDFLTEDEAKRLAQHYGYQDLEAWINDGHNNINTRAPTPRGRNEYPYYSSGNQGAFIQGRMNPRNQEDFRQGKQIGPATQKFGPGFGPSSQGNPGNQGQFQQRQHGYSGSQGGPGYGQDLGGEGRNDQSFGGQGGENGFGHGQDSFGYQGGQGGYRQGGQDGYRQGGQDGYRQGGQGGFRQGGFGGYGSGGNGGMDQGGYSARGY